MKAEHLPNILIGKVPLKVLVVLVLTTLLAGCGIVAQKNRDELLSRSTPADWGVLDDDHETIERAIILRTLKDPDSAKIRFFKAVRDIAGGLSEPMLVWYSWYYVNAKNAFGGYTGEQPYAFKYRCPVGKKCQILDIGIPSDQYKGEVKWQR